MKAILHGGPDDGTEVEILDYRDIHTMHHHDPGVAYLGPYGAGGPVHATRYIYRAVRVPVNMAPADLGTVKLRGGPGWMTRLDSEGRVVFKLAGQERVP